MTEATGEAFWAWALAAYARPGAAKAALALQDSNGACVMVLLCLCWRAARGVEDDAASIGALRACAALLEEHLLVPLRAARAALTAAAPHVPRAGPARETLLARELVIERLQAGPLASCPEAKGISSAPAAQAAVRAVTLYLRLLGSGNPRSERAARSFVRVALPVQD